MVEDMSRYVRLGLCDLVNFTHRRLVCQITDFGVSDVFRMCWEKKTHLSKGLCGSEPYIAPEQFDHKGKASGLQIGLV